MKKKNRKNNKAGIITVGGNFTLPGQKSGQEEQIRKSIERLPEMIRYCLKRAELKFDEKEKATTFTFPEECILEKQYVIDHKELIEKSIHTQIIV
jgi:DNA polymerase-3 subunit gamma/tau